MAADAGRSFRTYSTGMRQRLAIARSLLHQPTILFMDEPSRSLDPTATARLHRLIRQLMDQQQMTVFLITHDLAEAESLCRRVAVMNHGRIQVVGQPVELRRRLKPTTRYVILVDAFDKEAEEALRILFPDLRCERAGEHLRLAFTASDAGDGGYGINAGLDTLRAHNARIQNIESFAASLEEVFAHYTGGD